MLNIRVHIYDIHDAELMLAMTPDGFGGGGDGWEETA